MKSTNIKVSGKKKPTKKQTTKSHKDTKVVLIPIKKVTKTVKVKLPAPTNSVENIHNVPLKMWKKFEKNGQKMYNNVMEQSDVSIDLIAHPKMPVMNTEHWKTIRHNFACFAAWGALKR